MYRYVVDELPGFIAANFPADAERSGIFGHSMGGHGALTIGLKNPQKYRSLSAFAPIAAPIQSPWGLKAFTGYLGAFRGAWSQYDATELVKAGQRFESGILVDQGTADKFLDDQLKPGLLAAACKEAGQPLELRLREGYDHGYFFIQTFIADTSTGTRVDWGWASQKWEVLCLIFKSSPSHRKWWRRMASPTWLPNATSTLRNSWRSMQRVHSPSLPRFSP